MFGTLKGLLASAMRPSAGMLQLRATDLGGSLGNRRVRGGGDGSSGMLRRLRRLVIGVRALLSERKGRGSESSRGGAAREGEGRDAGRAEREGGLLGAEASRRGERAGEHGYWAAKLSPAGFELREEGKQCEHMLLWLFGTRKR